MVSAKPDPGAAPGSLGVGEMQMGRTVLRLSPPNPNLGLDQFVSNGSFDAQAWFNTAKANPSWDAVSWSSSAWSGADFNAVAWSDVSWETVSWGRVAGGAGAGGGGAW